MLETVVAEALQGLQVGAECRYDNMVVYPLISKGVEAPTYITLDEAIASGVVTITEISEGGSVPELKLTNVSDRDVLLIDGEELLGAKQNRVANLTILAPAHQTITIPVSCVEAGRWNPTSREFATSGRAHFSEGRAHRVEDVSNSLRGARSRRSNQSVVWSIIGSKLNRMDSPSGTMAMAAMYERHGDSVDRYVDALKPVPGQVGAVFVVNGRVVGCELFDSPETLERLLPKVTRSVAMEALDPHAGQGSVSSREGVQQWLDSMCESELETYPALGTGSDVRFKTGDTTGAALVVDGRVVHLTAHNLGAYRSPNPVM